MVFAMDDTLAKTLEIRMPADTRYVGLVRRGIRSLAESVGFTGEDVSDVEVAVSEAVTNSVIYGSPDPEACEVVVKCRASGECLEVEVEDESTAESLPVRPASCDPAAERGRGFIVMCALMDECHDSRTERGIRIRMAKQKARRES